jgi:hypothetical protein
MTTPTTAPQMTAAGIRLVGAAAPVNCSLRSVRGPARTRLRRRACRRSRRCLRVWVGRRRGRGPLPSGKEEGGGAIRQSDAVSLKLLLVDIVAVSPRGACEQTRKARDARPRRARALRVDAPAGVVDTQPPQHLQQRGVPANESGDAGPDVALARRLSRGCGGLVGTATGFVLVGHVYPASHESARPDRAP